MLSGCHPSSPFAETSKIWTNAFFSLKRLDWWVAIVLTEKKNKASTVQRVQVFPWLSFTVKNGLSKILKFLIRYCFASTQVLLAFHFSVKGWLREFNHFANGGLVFNSPPTSPISFSLGVSWSYRATIPFESASFDKMSVEWEYRQWVHLLVAFPFYSFFLLILR